MKTRWLWILLIVAALPLSAQDKAAAPQAERARSAGVELGTPPAKGAKAGRTTCTLTLAPNHASNGQSFSFTVGYTPCMTQAQTETFTFKWPSTLAPDFTEVTVRTKIFKKSLGCVVASADSTLVPTALAIKGSFKAQVVVRNSTTNALICTASAPFTVP